MAEPKVGQPVSRRLGDLLVREGLISQDNLSRALAEQKTSNEKLGSILVRLSFISEDQLVNFLSKQYGIPAITLTQLDIDAEVIKLVPGQIAQKYEVLPIQRQGNTLTLAMADPTNVFAIDDVGFMTNLQVVPVVASQGAIRKALELLYEV
jgi:type IV pilus assembly protein PilB